MAKERELKELVKALWWVSRFGTEEEVKKATEEITRFYYENPDYFDE